MGDLGGTGIEVRNFLLPQLPSVFLADHSLREEGWGGALPFASGQALLDPVG